MEKVVIGNASLYNCDCVEAMAEMLDNSVDLTVTSPPYDNLRDYNGFSFDFEKVAKELFRITKHGGVVVWVVGDSVVEGSETGTSFRQALFFKEIGFNLHDTMIYQKNSYPFPPSNRYYQQAEFMFVLSKGTPKTFNGIMQKTEWRKSDKEISTTRNKDGSTVPMKYGKGREMRLLDNIWRIDTGFMRTTADVDAYAHPAMFPEKLASQHIVSWSNEGDIVFDCFTGSGTTGKMAVMEDRYFIGCEISKEYFDIACRRIETAQQQLKLSL